MSNRRTQLIEAAIELFSKEGFWNSSTAQISKHAGVATGTLFNYFPSKEILINEVYLQLKKEARDYVLNNYPATVPLAERMEYLWNQYAYWAIENPDRFRLMEQLRLSEMVSEKTVSDVEGEEAFMIEVISEACTLRPPENLGVRFVCKMTYAILAGTITYALTEQLSGQELQSHLDAGFSALLKGLFQRDIDAPLPDSDCNQKS